MNEWKSWKLLFRHSRGFKEGQKTSPTQLCNFVFMYLKDQKHQTSRFIEFLHYEFILSITFMWDQTKTRWNAEILVVSLIISNDAFMSFVFCILNLQYSDNFYGTVASISLWKDRLRATWQTAKWNLFIFILVPSWPFRQRVGRCGDLTCFLNHSRPGNVVCGITYYIILSCWHCSSFFRICIEWVKLATDVFVPAD